ncbi:cyclase family protein [Microbacterium sp.]|uniref:cyclase family protein n=1 Tax=Microbacterium sp. TaxID=51671 RepID=UPI0039C9124C
MLRDLIHPIRDGMMVYPGDPGVSIGVGLSLAKDGVEVARIEMGSHTGTHVDAPATPCRMGGGLRRMSLSMSPWARLSCCALLRRVPARRMGSRSRRFDGGAVPDALPRIVIVDAGRAQWFGSERALRHPFMSASAARELSGREMRVLALDTLSPDATGERSSPCTRSCSVGMGRSSRTCAGSKGCRGRVEVGFFPLRLSGDGASVRAIAFGKG